MDEEIVRRLKDKIGKPSDVSSIVTVITQLAMAKAIEEKGPDGPTLAGITLSSTLGTLVCAGSVVGKKNPNGDEAAQLRSVTAPETLMFCALAAALQVNDSAHPYDKDHMALAAELGPSTFGLALDAWQKLYPDKKIEDYIEQGLANIAREALANSVKPFEEFLDKNKRGYFLPNNGSIN